MDQSQISKSVGSRVLVSLGRLLIDNVHHLFLDGLLLENKSILVPNEIWCLRVEPVLLHAALEQTYDVAVVGVLRETETSAVMHELSEFLRLVLAQIVNRGLLLFLFDGSVFLSLGPAGKSLPWEGAFEEVENDVADGF